MTINKFQGKTKEEAIEKAKNELGPGAVVMNVREIKPKGFFRLFKRPTFEVTAALEEKETYVNPLSALISPKKIHDNINLAADEKIEFPRPVREATKTMDKTIEKPKEQSRDNDIEKRLDDLSSMLEEKLKDEPKEEEHSNVLNPEALNFIRILYKKLIENEVNEKYVNQIIEEVEQFIRPGTSVDMILANVYQKLILRFGRPESIQMTKGKTKVVFFIGPTGVGKTTTIAKIASRYKVEQDNRVAFITADTYRIAATEQLRVYANILDVPMSVVYSSEELNDAIEKLQECDLIFVDTAGFSHRNETQREDIKNLIQNMDERWDKEVYLVLSATTKYKDLLEIVDIYREISDFKLIFTKLDETSAYGNLLNIKLYSGADLSYMTNGQNVPDDIELFNIQKIVKQILGGR
jgi:flagellar biosynthesis protein FlhF